MNTPTSACLPSFHPALPVDPAFVAVRKLRICIASFDFVGPVKNGGVGTAFTSLGEAMAAAGHEVTLLFLAGNWCENQTLDHWISHYRARGIRFVPLPESGLKINSRWHVNKAYEGYLWLKTQNFDVIHFSEWKAPGYFVLRAKHQGLGFARTLLCVHTHGPTLWHKLSNAEYVTHVDDIELDYLERHSVQLADVVVSPSQYLLRWMRERGWVLPQRCFVQQYVRPATARQPKPDADCVHRIQELVFFGRLEVRKGLVLFCDALDELSGDPELRQLKITCLGKADRINGQNSADYLAARAKGWPWAMQVVSDRDQAGAMDYLQGAGRLAVIPSLVDNLPNTVLECLGAQVPFLASNAGGIPEMIAGDDLAATLFPLKAKLLAEKLRHAVGEGVRPARYAVNQTENELAWVRWHEGLSQVEGGAFLSKVDAVPASQPLVSVCMSHWNRPAYLRQALASIEAQDYPNLEVVLVDDGSSTPEAKTLIGVLETQFKARGWQVLRNSENLYPGAARNRSAKHARGEFLMFMDDDNCAKPHEISMFVRVAQRTHADIVSCALDTFAGEAAPHDRLRPTNRWLFLGDDVATGAFRNNFGDTNSLWRREAFLAAGGFHEEWGVGHEDWELYAKAVMLGYKLEVVPEPLAWYRLNETEATVNRKTPLHANHQANIRPYLAAVPSSLRNLVLYAQGASLCTASPEQLAATAAYTQLTIQWKSKLEAANALISLRQTTAAVQLLLEGIRAVESCRHPLVILEALTEIPARLGQFDPGKARYLLECAAKFAEDLKKTAASKRINDLLSKLPKASPKGAVPSARVTTAAEKAAPARIAQ